MSRKGRGAYPPGWFDVAASVKADAGGECVRCGHAHEPAAGYCLTVHHFDGDRGNNHRGNLMPLCQRCHLSVQARAYVPQGMLGEPSSWALPWVAHQIDAGATPAPPTYDAERWARRYESDTGKAWPAWAPRPLARKRPTCAHVCTFSPASTPRPR